MSQRVNQIIGITSLFLVVSLVCSCAKVSFVEPYEGAVGTGTLSIRVSVGDENPLTEGVYPSSQRTIAPEQITGTNLNNYTLQLTASNIRQGDIVRTLTLTNGKTIFPDIPYGTWQLKLVALDNQTNTPVLEAVSGAIIDYVKPVEVQFVLKPVEGGTGNVNVQFNLNTTDFTQLGAGSTVKIGLYDPIDYKVIDERTPVFAQNLTYNPQGIPAGEYVLRLTITAGANGTLKQGAFVTWSDRIVVEVTRTSSATLTLTQMFQKPNSPTNLTFTNNGVTAGVATVSLAWSHVHTADSYELEVLEYTGTTVTAGNWDAVAGNADSKLVKYNAIPNDPNNYLAHTNKYASQYYIDGGLLPCQNRISLGLQISTKSYAARIRATNFYGDSAWVYFTAPATRIPTIAAPTAPTNFDFTTGYYDATGQSFTTNFTWNDNSNNEDGFELELMKISKNSVTPRTDNAWNALVGNNNVTTYKGNNIGSSGGNPSAYEGGSLSADSIRLRLSMKRLTSEYYVVRLRSYNDGGNSTWVYPPAPKLLLPIPLYTPTTNQIYSSGGSQVYDATLNIQDIAGNTFTYQYEWIALRSGNLTPLFTAQNQANRDAAWMTLRNRPENDTPPFRSGGREATVLQIPVRELNANTPFPFRVRTVVKSGNTVDATPWYYHLKKIINQ